MQDSLLAKARPIPLFYREDKCLNISVPYNIHGLLGHGRVRVIMMGVMESYDSDFLKRRIATLKWDISMIKNESVIAKKQQELEEYMALLESLQEDEEDPIEQNLSS